MPTEASLVTPAVVAKFIDHCCWVHEAWATHLGLSDENPWNAKVSSGCHRSALYRLSVMTQEHFLLQVRKLHDPAKQVGRWNLCLAFLVEQGHWKDATRTDLAALQSKLSDLLGDALTEARNRLLSHNDLEAMMSDEPLGAFEEGLDKKYFLVLQQFCDKVSTAIGIGPRRYYGGAKREMQFLMKEIVEADARNRGVEQ